ncbi:RNA-binding domain-containing protein [Halocatena halophila]|uniref:RNA-binding domain-containing protein n=1 Tax=Halocatena halophila TaxID=2814576 RepID=UPI002ED09F7A
MSSQIFHVTATFEAPVYATERTERVIEAIDTLAPEATVETQSGDERAPGTVVARTHSLERLSERFHEQAILDSARTTMLDGLTPETNTVTFRLKKQAAYADVVNFAVGDPDELGDITVTITVSEGDPAAYVRQLAPPTEDGVPVDDE